MGGMTAVCLWLTPADASQRNLAVPVHAHAARSLTVKYRYAWTADADFPCQLRVAQLQSNVCSVRSREAHNVCVECGLSSTKITFRNYRNYLMQLLGILICFP